MSAKFHWFRISFPVFFIATIAVFFIFFSQKGETAKQTEKTAEFLQNFDIRVDLGNESKEKVNEFISRSGQSPPKRNEKELVLANAVQSFLNTAVSSKVEFSEALKIPEVISLQNSFDIQKSNDQDHSQTLRSFLKENLALFGLNKIQIEDLKFASNYSNPDGNLSFVVLEQKIDDIPVFQGEVKAGFTKQGGIIRIINNLAPNLIDENLSNEFGTPQNAVINAARHIGVDVDENDTKLDNSTELKTTFERGRFSDKTTSEKFYFPVASGVALPAWRVLLWTENAAYYVIVEAENGTLLWRKNITDDQTQSATFNVYGNSTSFLKTHDSPAPFTPGCSDPNNCPQPPIVSRQSFSFIGNEPPYEFNTTGWIPDGENRTIGNAVEAGIDRMNPSGIDDNGWAFGTPNRNFVYTYNPAPGDPAPGEEPLPTPQTYPPSQFQQGTITNAFYAINRWHDEMYLLGFNEAARNFQTDNFGRGGIGNDSISVEVQDFTGSNGANFATPADGGRGRLQLFIWTGSTPSRDGGLDNQVAIHEVSHGLSNRLHGNASGLTGNMARGMGEGWSDFYSYALLSDPSDDPLGIYSEGCYSIAGISDCYHGIRRFPTTRISVTGPNGLPHNPLTFRYLNSDCNTLIGTTTSNPSSAYPRGSLGSINCDQVHNMGEVWAAALWEVRGFLIEAHGAAEGNRRALKYITDGMKLAPINPTMLQERDAIIAATQALNSGDVRHVWRGFAIRGMGLLASIQNVGNGNNTTVVTESFATPSFPSTKVRADFDGDGKTDVSVFRPSEGNWYVNGSTAGFSAVNWGGSSDKPVPGDFDGDGKTDFAIFRSNLDSSQPDFFVLNSSNFTFSGSSWGVPDDLPVIEDYDGDGKSDFSVYRPSNHTFYVLKSTGGLLSFSNIEFGTPAAGDFDGDGKGDFVTFSIDGWFLAPSNINYGSVNFVRWGAPGDQPVSADYDGDGKDDFAVFRPSDQTWYIRNSNGGNTIVNFGLGFDVPAPGDYDGDGKSDIALYRNGTWYIIRSTGGILITQFGLSGDKPIPNTYLQ